MNIEDCKPVGYLFLMKDGTRNVIWSPVDDSGFYCEPAFDSFTRMIALYDGVDVKRYHTDALRYRRIRSGKAYTVIVPAPTSKNPNGTITIITADHIEEGYGDALDKTLDQEIK